MSYLTQDSISHDDAMFARVAQCAATEHVQGSPDDWTFTNRRTWAAAPGWAEAWESAAANGNETPGSDPAVITDAMILSQVQSMLPAG